jgi:parallel beta-helix repeat protein
MKAAFVSMFLFLFISTADAQPSGGPYGPIRQVYELPETDGTIYYVAPDGLPSASGRGPEAPVTIEAAVERAVTGDVIVLRGGLYRTGGLILNQGITIQPYRDEQPVLKGTYVATDWEALRGGLWRTKWDRLFPDAPQDWWRREREGMLTPLHRFNNDMVFIDGRFLQSAGWEGEVDEDSHYIDYDGGYVYIAADPTDRLVEITAYDVAIHRTIDDVHGKSSDGRGFTIRGITFTQYAYRAFEIDGKNPEGVSPETDHGKDVIGSTLENCTISYCSRVAGYFRGDSLTIRNCRISDTSTEGIFILSSNDVLLERNVFERNNIEHITGYYPAAVKIFNQCHRVTVRDNLVIDHPHSNGIWYDVGNVDGVFVNNWIEGVGNPDRDAPHQDLWPSDNGFFFEISRGVTVAGNVFVNNDRGLMILNAADALIYNNTFINSTALIARTPRSAVGDHFGWHPATGPDVDEREGHVFVNNLLAAAPGADKPLLVLWQTANLCDRLTDSMMERKDHNVYVRGTGTFTTPIVVWSPARTETCLLDYHSLDALRERYPEYSRESRFYPEYDGPLFQSLELRNLGVLPGFPGLDSGTAIPGHIGRYLGRFEPGDRFIGAYPPLR